MKEKEKKLSKEDTTKNVDKIKKKRKQEQVEKKEKQNKKKYDNTYGEKVTDKITLKTDKEQYKHTKSMNENEKCQSDPSKDKDSSSVGTSNIDSTSFSFIQKLIEQRIPNVARDLSTRLSIAIPSTIINHKNDVLKAYITSYLARICTIFSIDKIYIYDDQFRYEQEAKPLQNENDGSWNNQTRVENFSKKTSENRNEEENKKKEKRKFNNNNNGSNNEYSYLCRFLHCNLQYLETPQYLRKHLFPITPFLKNTGIMNPVDAPHHLRSDEWLPFREGVLIEKKENGVIIDVGLFSNVFIKNENIGARERDLDIGTRVTVLFDETAYYVFQKKKKQKDILFTGKLISPRIPLLYNVYWGYTIEILKNVSDIFQLKFDYLVGTSERGTFINESCVFEKGKSILIVFGNKNGLEDLLIQEKEEKVKKQFSVEDRQIALNKILKKFHFFINICAFQTSRTIRTEEALTITLSLIHNVLK